MDEALSFIQNQLRYCFGKQFLAKGLFTHFVWGNIFGKWIFNPASRFCDILHLHSPTKEFAKKALDLAIGHEDWSIKNVQIQIVQPYDYNLHVLLLVDIIFKYLIWKQLFIGVELLLLYKKKLVLTVFVTYIRKNTIYNE